ncbi:proteoglycan 4-like [Abrus precatorius]|uniref:Proteoglycan 4-like n=1 Tax=Abrus precatorius TaxID=3816 RepID=A0A8B8L9I6_ABRPR|nr:proteoglycan 4-like [Abrus precatorius]
MAMSMGFMAGKGLSTTQMVDLVMDTLYMRFAEKNVNDFDGFNVGILDTFNTINMALPGKHYVAPSYKDVKNLFKQWKEAKEEDKKKMFIDFINENVNINKVDESMIITAIVAPPAAMMAKKIGKIVPQLALMNVIPDVIFVPSATILAISATKILRLMVKGKTTSEDAIEQDPQTPITPPTEPDQTPITPPAEPDQTPITPPNEPDQTPITPPAEPDQTPVTPPAEPDQTPITPPAEPDQTPVTPAAEPDQTPITPPSELNQTPITPPTEPDPPTTTEPTELDPPTTPEPIEAEHLPRHVHKDKTFCALCDYLIAKAKEGRTKGKQDPPSNAMALKTQN